MSTLINKSTSVLLKEVWSYINIKRKCHLASLLFLILIVSLIEMLTIGLVLPFLAILTNPDKFLSDQRFESFLKFLKVNNSLELIKLGTLVFILAILLTAIS
jgi:ATP-binding cassette subfamily B protein